MSGMPGRTTAYKWLRCGGERSGEERILIVFFQDNHRAREFAIFAVVPHPPDLTFTIEEAGVVVDSISGFAR